MTDRLHPETAVASIGVGEDQERRAVAPPLYLSATYRWADLEHKPQFDYSRSGNPTRKLLENALCELEGAASCAIVSSGMAAIDLVLCLVPAGGLVVAPHDCYGGTHRLLSARAKLGQIKVAFVDQRDPAAYAAALADKPRLVLLETPSNPLLRIIDLTARAHEAKAAGALAVADNTFLSPARQKPIAHGCDVVVHSTTKFLNGHSDVVGGATLSADPALGEELAWWANCIGSTGAPFDSYLTLRGLRTLFVRVERQEANAGAVAERLAADDRVAKVYYPGLASHEGHDIAKAQQSGFGSILSIDLAPHVDAERFVSALALFNPGASLGGFESLVSLPARMTHAAMPAQARARAGISDRLVRLSIGIEHADDLIADIDAALAAAAAPPAALTAAE